VLVERRATEPVLPLWIFKVRVLNASSGSAVLVGILMVGLSTYVPLYAQSVLGTSALTAGFTLAAMTIGWPLSTAFAGRFYLTIGFRKTMQMGSAIVLLGTALLVTVGPHSSIVHLGAACFVIGFGLGFTASPGVVAAQSSVDWRTRGVVTGANMFSRSVGSALGVAAFGAVANAVIASRIDIKHPDLDQLPASVLDPAIGWVFVCAATAGALLLVAASFMPSHIENPQ